ncbi:hypothetical protein FVF58_09485 [Paraburkholderia panacisoli]|uniref:Uncharacterized protein n=1 Tax=Paraburkholderia panacisoli TaxID=2603818 RepID=A0A5B0HD16_9BURK|nr:hypothetical protein [Paraburkholderia panacisoli]KAA1013012.1 hypothetical protein FVF58_09485 [Paraburkholderia panacisoli]
MKKWRGRVLIAEKIKVVEELGFSAELADEWYGKFLKHQNHALDRSIKSLLTFSQYMTKVRDAGISSPAQIGRKRDQFQMGRIGDVGDYEENNCRFITAYQNHCEARANSRFEERGRLDSILLAGQTKHTSERYRKISEALSGRTAETHSYIAKNAIASANALRGRTKQNDPRMVGIADKLARDFVIRSPGGQMHEGRNLKEHCAAYGLNYGHMAAVLRGKEKHHKGWTGSYVNDIDLATLETIPAMPEKLDWAA